MKKSIFLILTLVAIMSAMVTSCKKPPAPTAEIIATVENYKVTFNPAVTDATTYSWDFGDDSDLSTEKNPIHTYESFGDYIVELTVTGEGGSFTTTKTISIAATSVKDLLTGGQSAASGKTWVLDQSHPFGDGLGPVMNSPYTIVKDSSEIALDFFGLEAEYDNEFTFFFNGDYSVNPKNENVLAGAVIGYDSGTIYGEPAWDIGLCAAAWSAPVSATWTLNTSPLVVDAIGDPNDPNPTPDHGNVTITGKNWISLSSGAFFGVMDFPTTAQFIIDEITPNKMRVTLFICGYYPGEFVPEFSEMPTNMFHLSYITK